MPIIESLCYYGTQIPIMPGDRIKRIDTRSSHSTIYGKIATVKTVDHCQENFVVDFDDHTKGFTSDLTGNYWELVKRQ